MEIIFEKRKPRLSKAKSGTSKKKVHHRGGSIKLLRDDLHKVMRLHGISAKHSKEAIKHIEGAGFFDIIKDVVSKGTEFYRKHKDTIDKGVELALEHGPSIYKTLAGKGGSKIGGAPSIGGSFMTPDSVLEKRAEKMKRTGKSIAEVIKEEQIFGGSKTGGAKHKKRTLPPALKKWNEDVTRYQHQHGCTRKEAMIKLKKRK